MAYFGPDRNDRPGLRSVAETYGTSVAAPMVTGSLAAMKQLFRGQLSNADLVTRLLATADKRGIYADRAVYGQGMLDLAAATAPVGGAVVATGDRVGGGSPTLAGTRFAVGGALGDSLARGLAGQEIAAFDALGAPFWFPLGALAAAGPGVSAAARLRGFMAAGEDRSRRRAGGLRPSIPRRMRRGCLGVFSESAAPGAGISRSRRLRSR